MVWSNPLNGTRASGRTKAMIQHAEAMVRDGRRVFLVFLHQATATAYRDAIRKIFPEDLWDRIQGITPDDKRLDFLMPRILDDHTAIVLVDHHVYETKFSKQESLIYELKSKLAKISDLCRGS